MDLKNHQTDSKDYVNDLKNHQIDYDQNRNYYSLYCKYSSSNSTSDKDYINDSLNHQIDYDVHRNYKSLYYITDSKNHQSDIFYKKYLINKNSKSSYQSDKDYKSLYYKYKMKYLNLKESNIDLKKDLNGGDNNEPINIKFYIASFKKLSNSKGPCSTFVFNSNVKKFNNRKVTDAENIVDKNLWKEYINFDPEYKNKTFGDIRGDYKCKSISDKFKNAANKLIEGDVGPFLDFVQSLKNDHIPFYL